MDVAKNPARVFWIVVRKNRHSPPERVQRCGYGMIGTCWAPSLSSCGCYPTLIGGAGLTFRQRVSLEAEVLFLRRQLALYVERRVKPSRLDAATRVSLALLSRLFEWRSALVVVRPETLIRWSGANAPRSP